MEETREFYVREESPDRRERGGSLPFSSLRELWKERGRRGRHSFPCLGLMTGCSRINASIVTLGTQRSLQYETLSYFILSPFGFCIVKTGRIILKVC